MQILVFKTNLSDDRSIADIEQVLDVHPHIIQWNVDLKDNDNILRIISNTIKGNEVEHLLFNEGYYCEELQ